MCATSAAASRGHLVEVVDTVGGEQQLVGREGDGSAVVSGEEKPAEGQRMEQPEDLERGFLGALVEGGKSGKDSSWRALRPLFFLA